MKSDLMSDPTIVEKHFRGGEWMGSFVRLSGNHCFIDSDVHLRSQ